MDSQALIDAGRQSLEAVLMIASPVLLVALGVGLVIGVFQAATQVNEMTLSFIPKIVALVLVLIAAGPWIMTTLVNYTDTLIRDIPLLIG